MSRLIRRAVLLSAIAGILLAVLGSRNPAHAAITILGQTGCPTGQVVGGANLVVDGNFEEAFKGNILFETDLPNRGPGVYPDDGAGSGLRGGFSIQKGNVIYDDGVIVGHVFPGDPSHEAAPSETYFYSNPLQSVTGEDFYFRGGKPSAGLLWKQTANVLPNTTYNFYAYFDNLLLPTNAANEPVIELRVDDPADAIAPIAAGPPITISREIDTWILSQYAFKTGPLQNKVTLEIWDVVGLYSQNPTYGDDFGMVGVNLRQCASALGLAKSAEEPVRKSDGSYEVSYTLMARNYGDSLITNLQVVDVLTQTFSTAASFDVIAKSTSPNVTLNPSFTGISPNTLLLAGTDTLDPGETATITFTVHVTPGKSLQGRGPFRNSAIVSGNAGTVRVEDDSFPGADPAPGSEPGQSNPKEYDRPTVVNLGTNIAIPFMIQP